ncbi:putative odorant receptor 83c [Drosophila takahashii]|uniref:putative odorant receptor 83c n=1 Tax=Drosophila takahashii TaxID=29030 RepID=UPI0007E7C847|nr:putative odorant receptor 83c [Drosophila takahashii]
MSEPVAVSPASRFRELSKNINSLTNLLGVDVLAPKLEFNYRTWTTIFAIVNYTGFTVFSILNNGGDWGVGLKASLMGGGLFHGLGKFLTCLLKHQDMRRLILYSRSIYEKYESRGISYHRTLNSNIDRLLGIMRIIRNGYVFAFCLMGILPLAMLMYDGTRVTAMQYLIPGLPLENNFCYTVTYLIQLVTMVVQGVGFYAGDLFVFLGLTQILTFADLLQLKINELNDALELKAENRALVTVGAQIKGEELRQYLLIEVIKWHQLFTDYCRTVNGLYYELIATQVLSMALAMMLSFCINLSSFHMPSAIFFVVSAYSMSIYCILGTILEFGYDQVYESICNVTWYELCGDQRKLFRLMLRESQFPHTIRILGVMSLSVRTALQIVKLIYSVSMMMMNRT